MFRSPDRPISQFQLTSFVACSPAISYAPRSMATAIVTGPEQLLLELFAIFVSAKAVGELFERIRLPSVLGEILAGAVLGPYALGWIPVTATIHSVADLGAIFVLFSAGLETSPGELIRIGGKSMRVAVAGV